MPEIREQSEGFRQEFLEPEMTEEEAREQVAISLQETGCEERVPEDVVERLVRLARFSRYFFDSVMISRATSNILDYITKTYSGTKPEINLTEGQKARGRLAALLHDVGKSGPAKADAAAEQAVLALFRIETRTENPAGVRFGDRLVGDVVAERYPDLKEKILELLNACGIESGNRMRQFWDRHSYWTKEILEAAGGSLSMETKIIAASHHIDKGHDPYGLLKDEAGDTMKLQTRMIGTMEEYIQGLGAGYAEKLEQRVLIAADKYEAAVRRSEYDHADAYASLLAELGNVYEKDELMQMVLAAIEELGKKGAIFR